MSKVFGVPINPHEPPWLGYPGVWWYQSEFMGGRKMAGGAVVDFVVEAGQKSDQQIGFRLVTERFHLYADAETQASDQLQLWRLSEHMRVVDLYDQDFLQDASGQTAIVLIKDALAGRIQPNPNTQGTTQRVTRLLSNVS